MWTDERKPLTRQGNFELPTESTARGRASDMQGAPLALLPSVDHRQGVEVCGIFGVWKYRKNRRCRIQLRESPGTREKENGVYESVPREPSRNWAFFAVQMQLLQLTLSPVRSFCRAELFNFQLIQRRLGEDGKQPIKTLWQSRTNSTDSRTKRSCNCTIERRFGSYGWNSFEPMAGSVPAVEKLQRSSLPSTMLVAKEECTERRSVSLEGILSIFGSRDRGSRRTAIAYVVTTATALAAILAIAPITQSAEPSELKFKTYNAWRTRFLPSLKGGVSARETG